MRTKITYEILDTLQYYRLEAYFRLRGEVGAKSDFEKLTSDAHQKVRVKAVTKIRRQHGKDELETDVQLSVAVLRKGTPYFPQRTHRGRSSLDPFTKERAC